MISVDSNDHLSAADAASAAPLQKLVEGQIEQVELQENNLNLLVDPTYTANSTSVTIHFGQPKKQFTGWFMLLIALAIHTLFLFSPTTFKPQINPSKTQKEKPVKITRLTAIKKMPKLAAKPKPVPQKTAIPALPSPRKAPKEQDSQVDPLPQASPKPTPAKDNGNPWDDFPNYPGAKTGCFNLGEACYETGTILDQVVAHFDKSLAAKKYEAKAIISELNRKVYEVSKNGLKQYLSLIVTSDKGTIYVVSEEPRKLEDLSKAIAVPPELSSIFENVDAVDAEASQFSQPELFFSKDSPKPLISAIKFIADPDFETVLYTYFQNNLRVNEFESSELPQRYGGGPVYEARKDQLVLYLNLLPDQTQTGTLVVVWSELPQ